MPVMTRITTTHAVADRNNRVASDEPRIRARSRTRQAGFRTRPCPDQRPSAALLQDFWSRTLQSSTLRRRRQEIAEAAHGLDDVDLELLADAADEHFDGVGIAVKILVVKVFDQFGTR